MNEQVKRVLNSDIRPVLVFTIFKCDYNVGVTIITLLFTYLTLYIHIYIYIYIYIYKLCMSIFNVNIYIKNKTFITFNFIESFEGLEETEI